MDWICSVCSTLNDRKRRKCIVCDSSRSRAAVKKEKTASLKFKIPKIGDAVYKFVNISTKMSTIIFIFALLVCLMIEIISGTLFDSIYENSQYLVNSMVKSGKINRAIKTIPDIFVQLFSKLWFSFSTICKKVFDTDFFENIKYIFNSILENLQSTHLYRFIKKKI